MPSGLTFNSLPDISDPRESVRRASQLQFLIGANLLITLVGAGSAVAFVIPRSTVGVTILGVYLAVLSAFRVLGKRGWLLIACFGYCAFFWFSLALLTFVSGGVTSPVTPFFFPGMLIAAVLLGSGWACVYGAISASTLLAFGVFEAYGGQFPMLVSISLATRWTLFAIAMACAIPPVHVAISSMAASLRRAQSELAERMAAENRLRQSESGYRDIFDSIQDAFYRVDETGHLTLANRAFAEMLGYDSVDECLGKPMATTFYFDPADRQKGLNAIRRHGLVSNYEVTLKRKDGTPIQVAGNCSLKFDDRGHSCGVEGILRNITRQKQAHEAIARSEAKFGALFKYAPYSIGITRLPDGMILDVNPTFEKRTGYRRDEVVGKTALELGLWIEPEEGRKALAEVHSGQTILAREAHFRRRDGSLSTSLISFCPFDLLGERLVLFTSEDITEYKKTQEALRDKETMERLASVYSSDMQYSMKVEANGRVTFERISDSCSRLTGYSLPDLYRNETWGRIVHPHDLPAVKNQHQQHLIGKRTGPFEVRLQVKGGGVVWSRWHVEPIWNEDRSRVVRLLGIAQDITRRKQAELAMEEERVRFEGIVNSAFDGIIAIGTNLEVLVFNPAAERIFGRKSRVVLGDPVIQLFPERYRPTCSGTLELFSKAVGTDSGTARLEIPTGLRASGEEFPIEAFLSRVELHDGPMVTITCRDSSEQIRAEEARRRLEAQLRQAQKMEAIGTLAGGIAHDFNNILAAVMGYTEAAQLELVGNEAVRDSLDQVLSAAHRAKDLVQQILAFSRQRKHEPTAIMLQPVIKEALKLVRSTIPSSIEIKADLSPDAGPVLANGTQIHQVLLNLAANAAHAMHDRPGRLHITLAPVVEQVSETYSPLAKPGKTLRLTVSDTGHGMEPEVVKRIFEPFYTTKEPGEGTGLGLSVVHGIIHEHGGSIHVTSQIGLGTTFEILLPVQSEASDITSTEPRELVPGSGERVLFLDDEPALCSLGAKFLDRLNYRSLPLEDPLRALAEFEKAPDRFDLVLVDLSMPKMTGVDFAMAVLKIRPEIPVILMTGFNGSWDLETLQKLGIRDLILKPISLRTMAQTLRRALSPERMASASDDALLRPGEIQR